MLLGFVVFNWEDLKVFLAAYREGSIGRAAESLGVSGSTVSRRLTALEDALGQSLFVRSPDGLKPTDAAHKAWTAAEEAERSASRVEAVVGSHDAVSGLVRVAVNAELLSCVLIPQWPEFAAKHPDLTVEWIVSPGLSDLERWEADIGIRPVRPQTGENLVITRLRDTDYGLFARPELLRAHGLDPDDKPGLEAAAKAGWEGLPWVGWSTELSHLGLSRLMAHLYPDARIVFRAGSVEPQRLAAMAGVGLLLTPSYFGKVSPNLVRLPAPGLPEPTPLYMLAHTAVRHTARVDAVWEHLLTCLRGSDAEQLALGKQLLGDAYAIRFD